MKQSLSILVHAFSKIGKSTLAATSPRPQLILDAEGGTKFLPGSEALQRNIGRPFVLKRWNPREAPPRWDETWDACVVSIREWDDVRLAYQWLTQGEHDFRSLIVDSVTELQRRCKQNLKGTDAMQIQDWGQLLTLMDAVIRGLRDLSIDDHNSIEVVMFIAETRQNNAGKFVPYMQGQIATALPYWLDLVGFLYVDQMPDENGQATVPIRRLLVNPHPQYEAGERVQGRVGPVIDDPNVERILQAVYPSLTTPDTIVVTNQGESQ